VKTNALLMAEKGYRTVGEMFFLDPKFTDHKRNKGGDYLIQSLGTPGGKRLNSCLPNRKGLGNPPHLRNISKIIHRGFTSRLLFAAPGQIESKIGFCTFEKKRKRAPR
jgi:CRISPR-associated endonuclease Csn1